jgi:hypothetical protein
MPGAQRPLLSVVVVIVSDTTTARCDATALAETLEALARQADPPPMEILVPHLPEVDGLERVRWRFPVVRFIPVSDLKYHAGRPGSREHHDELRAHGIAEARGEIVALLEDHERPAPHWAALMAAEHRQACAGVGGAIENEVDLPLNWAVYFCDFGFYQNPVRGGDSDTISDVNASYKRQSLEAVGHVWRESFNQIKVNEALLANGERLLLSPDVIVYQHRLDLRLEGALQERYVWGRSYAAARCKWVSRWERAAFAVLTPALPAVLLLRMMRNVLRKGRCRREFLRALPLTALLSVCWSLGEMAGYWTGHAHRQG